MNEGLLSKLPGQEPMDTPMRVAVKFLKPTADPDDKRLFLDEAWRMRHLNHVNVVRLLGVCLANTPAFILLEYMDGEPCCLVVLCVLCVVVWLCGCVVVCASVCGCVFALRTHLCPSINMQAAISRITCAASGPSVEGAVSPKTCRSDTSNRCVCTCTCTCVCVFVSSSACLSHTNTHTHSLSLSLVCVCVCVCVCLRVCCCAPPPLSPPLLRGAPQVCEGLSYLGSVRFVHRDLAARNILMT